MEDREIKKALECSVKDKCPECPYFHSYPCDKCREMRKDALDLINRLQAQNKDLAETVHNLTIEKDALFDKAEELKAEVERLQNILLSFTGKVIAWSNKKGYDTTELSLIAILDEAKNVTVNIKAEAIKECTEKLKSIFGEWIYDYKTEDILKELVGDV